MITLLLAAQILIAQPGITVQAPPPPSQEEAAKILREAPGISNRTNVYVPSAEDQRRVVFVPTATSQPPRPIEPRRLDGTPYSQPPAFYGVPYPWNHNLLAWAILNSGRTK